ncbi:MAG: SUMF1/EgtB/PvdO family nonheme iron enzyme [Spirochaetaceae bacterium]|jgi:formylglycine-generating enzyme required for sulfatase activity|nr:SUMF1/EgtB/PvdO family nonheme iron enzyme [Spirochaetaceae bacterium]
MKKKTKHRAELPYSQDETAETDAVKLKPFLSLRPGQYLALLYGMAIALIAFFVFIFPGIARKSALYRFTSEPQGAAVRVDDVYQGQTPCLLTVPRGRHTITFVMPGFEEIATPITVKARLFIRPPFARAEKHHTALRESAPLAALLDGANEYAAWSFAGEPAAVYQIPYSLSTGAARSAQADGYADNRQNAEEILLSSLRFTGSRFALKDFIRAACYLESGGYAPSPGSLTGVIARAAAIITDEPRLTVIPAGLLPTDAAQIILESPLYPREVIDFSSEDPPRGSSRASFGPLITAGSVIFTVVGGGEFVQAANFPQTVRVEPFYIALNEISVDSWSAFTAENPEWRIENTGSLEKKGLISEGYLQTSGSMRGNLFAVSGLSAYAAEAYCNWLSTKLPAGMADWEVRLPTEAEWEYAAKSVQDIWQIESAARSAEEQEWDARFFARNNLPATMLTLSENAETGPANAGLWEWCADGFVPQNFFAASTIVPSTERNLRGGCWVNQPFSVTAETRASLPPILCSPFVSARPVIARKAL